MVQSPIRAMQQELSGEGSCARASSLYGVEGHSLVWPCNGSGLSFSLVIFFTLEAVGHNRRPFGLFLHAQCQDIWKQVNCLILCLEVFLNSVQLTCRK